MKLLLLCLGLILVCAQQEENSDVPLRNFDISKISGEWYSIFVASDIKEKVEEDGSMRIFVENIQPLDNSSLYFKFQRKGNEECSGFSLVADKTEEDAIYSVIYDGYNVFRINEFVNSDYIIIQLVNFRKNRPYQKLDFFAREPDVSPELKEEFVKIAQRQGIFEEKIFDLTQTDRCFLTRGSEVA
ncbi:major allergen Equ c 1-like [Equus przewalskii]|uniref:Lipocalin/cytosolic fatty-acid binding domain-containing protein n=2 Tax=Equus TaxID=9789 RepID=A0A5F5PJ61_HORSE|nr:major allergen Equ c 1 [Equus caballus]XP_008511376.1 PREDICTED: major allergen Equ c 1-like [Equus przewalskii]